MRRRLLLVVALLSLLLSMGRAARLAADDKPPPAAAVDLAYVRAHYTKFEFKIPMRDGVKLFTAVYMPKDTSLDAPILLTRTPYAVKPYGVDNYRAHLPYAAEGFIYAYQDVRGRYASEGQFIDIRPHKPAKSSPRDFDESTDAYDTIDWLVKNVPHNNRRVGMMGISYPGFYTAAGMIDSHPALKCASPQAPIADCFMGDDVHHHGAFYLADNFSFFSGFGQKLDDPTRDQPKPFDFKNPDAYDFYLKMGSLENADKQYFKGKIQFWDDLMRHGSYDDFWRSRNLEPHLKNIHAAVMTVGGWYDAEDLFGTLATYRAVERNDPGATNLLVMGPWAHGGWSGGDGDRLGDISFFAKTAEFYRNEIELAFLKHYLKNASPLDLPKAYVFETGTSQWRRYDSWPPKNVRPQAWYLRAGGHLSNEPPATAENAYDEYVSDPDKPVPASSKIATGVPHDYMLADQRFVASRPDVLVYQSEVLDDDLTIAGPIRTLLHVSTSGTDSDWVVKLIDVYPGDYPNPDPNPTGVQMGGYEQLVRGEPMRGKFRDSFEKPEPFVPGRVTRVEWEMPDVDHTFRRGHRIMVQVQSSWFPLVDRNPQKFCDIYHAQPADFQKATERIYHSPDAVSTIQVLKLGSGN